MIYVYVFVYMASAIMSFISHNKLKIIICVILLVIFFQTFRFLPWLSALQNSDIDHGPSPEGSFIPVAITVFYETLCPDSKNFVIKQLLPVVEKAPRLVTTSFVPYGKAKTFEDKNGNFTFSCQHGPTECLGNKVHACSTKSVSDQQRLVKYIACMIADNYDPISVGQACATKLGIDWNTIHSCTNSKEGDLLLRRFGDLTSELRPRVSFIPTVLLDNGQWNQAAILKNLFKEVCSHFKVQPEECQTQSDTSKVRLS